MEVNDIVKKIDEDMFFKIIEVIGKKSYICELVTDAKNKEHFKINEKMLELFMKPDHPNYKLPPIIVFGTVSKRVIDKDFDQFIDYYQEKLDRFPLYTDLKFYEDKNKVIVYTVLVA